MEATADEGRPLTQLEQDVLHFTPMPSSASVPAPRFTSPLTPLVCDEKAIARLLRVMLRRAGLSIGEASRRLGIDANSISQYLNGRRSRPSLIWFLKIAALCGATVTIEIPEKPITGQRSY